MKKKVIERNSNSKAKSNPIGLKVTTLINSNPIL